MKSVAILILFFHFSKQHFAGICGWLFSVSTRTFRLTKPYRYQFLKWITNDWIYTNPSSNKRLLHFILLVSRDVTVLLLFCPCSDDTKRWSYDPQGQSSRLTVVTCFSLIKLCFFPDSSGVNLVQFILLATVVSACYIMSPILSFTLIILLLASVWYKGFKLFLPWILNPNISLGKYNKITINFTFFKTIWLRNVSTGCGTVGLIIKRVVELAVSTTSAAAKAVIVFLHMLFIGINSQH